MSTAGVSKVTYDGENSIVHHQRPLIDSSAEILRQGLAMKALTGFSLSLPLGYVVGLQDEADTVLPRSPAAAALSCSFGQLLPTHVELT